MANLGPATTTDPTVFYRRWFIFHFIPEILYVIWHSRAEEMESLCILLQVRCWTILHPRVIPTVSILAIRRMWPSVILQSPTRRIMVYIFEVIWKFWLWPILIWMSRQMVTHIHTRIWSCNFRSHRTATLKIFPLTRRIRSMERRSIILKIRMGQSLTPCRTQVFFIACRVTT
jgi:hypothetical protein